MNPVVRLRMALAVSRKTELRAAERGVPTGEGDVVDGVGGIDPQVAAQPVTQSKRASSRGVQSELHGTRDGISSGVAPLARKRRSISRGIERQTRRSGVHRSASVIRPERAEDAGALLRQRGTRESAAARCRPRWWY